MGRDRHSPDRFDEAIQRLLQRCKDDLSALCTDYVERYDEVHQVLKQARRNGRLSAEQIAERMAEASGLLGALILFTERAKRGRLVELQDLLKVETRYDRHG